VANLEPDVNQLLSEASIFQSLEKHPGWTLVKEKMDAMVADATTTLNKVKPTDVDGVLAAHRDWRAVTQVRDTLAEYISSTKRYAAEYMAAQNPQGENQ
jgi:hypothetical protein